ncbi:MAG: hypothetical protein M3O26_13360 [Pseudomonadota bacterium]|nr:hypothetical protein [Pseudomonadota bacterium]
MAKQKLIWKRTPEAEDYEGARNYLLLIYSEAKSNILVVKIRKAKAITRAAKDLLRASGLPLLGPDDPRVSADLKRIHKAKPLPPVLLIRGNMMLGIPMVVADGYHRICAICHYDESAPVSCRLINA